MRHTLPTSIDAETMLKSTIMSRNKNNHLRLAGRPADYQKLGIDPVEVVQFEDGQRIGTEKAATSGGTSMPISITAKGAFNRISGV